jgi:hypothetical protein
MLGNEMERKRLILLTLKYFKVVEAAENGEEQKGVVRGARWGISASH